MSKKRIVAGFNLKQSGVIAKGEPITLTATVPENCKLLTVRIDLAGNFVLFCEVWSHPEGTMIVHRDEEFLIAATSMEIRGRWYYWDTLMTGEQLFHIFRREQPQILS